MKTFRLSRKVQIILVTIFVIVAGAIIAGTIANNRATATYTDCPNGDQSVPKINYYDDSYHYWICQECGASCGVENHVKYSDCTYKDGTYHVWLYRCQYCAWISDPYSSGRHENDSTGKCIYCKQMNDLGPGSGSGGGSGGGGGTCDGNHTQGRIEYTSVDDILHHLKIYCANCNVMYDEYDAIHQMTSWINNGNGTHSSSCNNCTYSTTASHAVQTLPAEAATCTTPGKTAGSYCSVCNATITPQTTIPALGHTQMRGGGKPATCTESGLTDRIYCSVCNTTIVAQTPIPALGHTGATHPDGTCTVCGTQYETHGQSSTIKQYKKTATGHTPLYACILTGCTSTYEGTEESHTGATHLDGTCTVCGTQYETHGQSSTIKEYKKTGTGHTPVYTCTQAGCTSTYEGTEVAHTGGTHPDGICTVCGTQYQTHGQSSTIKEYKKTATGHTPVYACTQSGCTSTYNGTTEAHTGATHPDGKCTVCGTQYETHGQSSTIKEYKKTATGHTPVYTCTYAGCTSTYEGTEEPHNNETYVDNGDGTHSSTCTECGGITTENHNYENGECKDCKSEEPEINIDTGKYDILEGYITQIQPKITADTFKNNVETNATEINIYNHNNELLENTDIVGTGMKLELKKGNLIKKFTLVVRGDTDGDGTSGMVDILIINKYRLHKTNLEEAYLKAGDVTGDGKVDFFDIIKINKFRLKKIIEL